MCEKISRSEKYLEVIASIECLNIFHEKREAMGSLAISRVWSWMKSKEITKHLPIK